ncbi:unnamed protein product [Miscanthus lutarioriparius]|uniref:Glabrous enhancer-binding protein-like DBD domain-containing protein n=1 Tax=Miscanthus lutarioriparius TaxID=422564 RepID=A0A811NZA2_9POAL|nr:unnamed protein product [Miscanthus lutarioriparius]
MDGRFSLQCQIQRMSVPIGPYKQGHKTTAPGSPEPRAASPACPKPLNPRAAAAMAPKRSAPPPPPVASSEETASGSGSEEEEEDDDDEEEEEIAHSPPPAAPKSIAPSRPKDQESEASDEDEDGEEEEEDEEEEDEKANHVIPSSATKNPPPPPPTREESETSDEEEEEEEEEADDEMPQTKLAPNQEMEAKGAKRSGAPFQRTWSTDDEFRILEALAAHRLEHGSLPQIDVLANALAGKLDNSGCSLSELKRKVKSLQSRNTKAVKKGALPSKDHDRRLFDLFKNVWPSVTKAATKAAPTKAAANSGAGREPDEMCELYPYLAEEVKALQKAHPGLFKREFAMIDDSKARALDEKIKRQRHAQMKLHLRRHDLTKVVTKTLMDLAK